MLHPLHPVAPRRPMTDRAVLARLAVELADDPRYSSIGGLLRQLATAAVTTAEPEPGTCQQCGRELVGRQRQWCTAACRSRAYRARQAP